MIQPSGLTLKFRPLQPVDFDLVVDWRAMPHLQEHFGKADRGQIEYDLMTRMESGWRFPNMALLGRRPIGCIEYYVLGLKEGALGIADPKGLLGLEFFLGAADLRGKGFGLAMVRQAASMLFREEAVIGLVAEVAPGNLVALGLLERVGFVRQAKGQEKIVMRLDRMRGPAGD